MTPPVRIVTHSGKCHADDVFAVASLVLLHERKNIPHEIIRSRDPLVWESGDYVIDVGDVYDASRNRFDHHQEGRAGAREDGIFYSSFGLVWKSYGETLCGSKEAADIVEMKLVEPIDAADNGMSIATPKYERVKPYEIGDVVEAFSLGWEERRSFDSVFFEILAVAKKILEREILRAQGVVRSRVYAEQAYKNAADKRLILLDRYFPWRDVLQQYPEPLFVVYPADGEVWHVKAVPAKGFLFKNRKDLPAQWAGKAGEFLAKITGVPDALFCHNNLFLAVAKTKEGAIALAKKALEV
ncbi:MAG: MYG1 family protein [Candidatus Lloydbacteria bacterium]|nr:MYG1 family protein [Candidatus Lloydbacteria bacterium]